MRNEKREGLIRTRLNGIKAATGDTIGPVTLQTVDSDNCMLYGFQFGSFTFRHYPEKSPFNKVILDSHIEVYHNWLPPLLQPIAEDRKTVVCPMIDIIDKDDFHYIAQVYIKLQPKVSNYNF